MNSYGLHPSALTFPCRTAVSQFPHRPVRRSEDAAVYFCLPVSPSSKERVANYNWELFHLELSDFFSPSSTLEVLCLDCFVWILSTSTGSSTKKAWQRGLQLGWYFLSSFFRISFQHTHRVLLQNHQCIQGLGGTIGVSHLPRDIPTEHQLRLWLDDRSNQWVARRLWPEKQP